MTDRLEKATQSLRDGNLIQALNEYQAIIATEPQNALAFQRLGYTLDRLRRYDEAITAYHKALELNPRLAASHVNLGVLYHLRRQFVQSEKEYRQAIELDPKIPEAFGNLGIILAIQGRLKEAETMVKRSIELDPTQAFLYCHLVEICLRQKHLTEAKEAVCRAFHRSPTLGTVRQIIWAIARAYPKQIMDGLLLLLTFVALNIQPVIGAWIGLSLVGRGALESILLFQSGARKQAVVVAVLTLLLLALVASIFLDIILGKLN